jgi:hypothetical protein
LLESSILGQRLTEGKWHQGHQSNQSTDTSWSSFLIDHVFLSIHPVDLVLPRVYDGEGIPQEYEAAETDLVFMPQAFLPQGFCSPGDARRPLS